MIIARLALLAPVTAPTVALVLLLQPQAVQCTVSVDALMSASVPSVKPVAVAVTPPEDACVVVPDACLLTLAAAIVSCQKPNGPVLLINMTQRGLNPHSTVFAAPVEVK